MKIKKGKKKKKKPEKGASPKKKYIISHTKCVPASALGTKAVGVMKDDNGRRRRPLRYIIFFFFFQGDLKPVDLDLSLPRSTRRGAQEATQG
jgi:hypothetical protein